MSYLINFWCQNFDLTESLESIIIRFSKQTDRLATFPQTSDHLHTRHKKWFKNEAHHNHRRRSTAAVQCTSSGSEIGRPTSCRESVIGSFSSVICFSNTGLADVDGAASSMFLSTFRVKTINKENDSKWITYSLFVSCGYNCIFKHVNAKPRQRKLAK